MDTVGFVMLFLVGEIHFCSTSSATLTKLGILGIEPPGQLGVEASMRTIVLCYSEGHFVMFGQFYLRPFLMAPISEPEIVRSSSSDVFFHLKTFFF